MDLTEFCIQQERETEGIGLTLMELLTGVEGNAKKAAAKNGVGERAIYKALERLRYWAAEQGYSFDLKAQLVAAPPREDS